jgi:predicted transcriptional regulator of viral defense system
MNQSGDKKINLLKKAIDDLPYFSIDDLVNIEPKRDSLRIMLSRLSKRDKIISLKRGIYVSKTYLEEIKRTNRFNDYAEFIGSVIYEPSYLSMEYVLDKYGILSEGVMALTFVSAKKTNRFSNELGIYKYHNIKKELFDGFEIKNKGDFSIAEASLAKALFDFLYYRKNILFNKEQLEELRLNLDSLSKKDISSLKKYITRENSKRMLEIFDYLIKQYDKNN